MFCIPLTSFRMSHKGAKEANNIEFALSGPPKVLSKTDPISILSNSNTAKSLREQLRECSEPIVGKYTYFHCTKN